MLKNVCAIALTALVSFSAPASAMPVDDINTAISAMQRKNIEQAKELLLRAIAAPGLDDEKKAYAYMLLSVCVNGTPEAVTYSAKAAELAPKNGTMHERYAEELVKAKRYEEAIASATKALEIKPVSVVALNARARAYREAKNFAGAIDDFTAAINLNADAGLNYAGRGKAYYLKGTANPQQDNQEDLDKASADLRKATESSLPGNLSGECYYYLAKIEDPKKHVADAERYCKRAIAQLKDKEKLEDANAMLTRIETIKGKTASNIIWQ
jgi:tetratricopeptide (TPR) repeat protein